MSTVDELVTTLSAAKDTLIAQGSAFVDKLSEITAADPANFGTDIDFSTAVWVGNTVSALTKPARPALTFGNLNALIQQLTTLAYPTAPSNLILSYKGDPGYSSAIYNPLVTKLLFDLINGGYGIDVNDEIRLFNRERDREALAAQQQVEEVKRQAASMSFPMPQGALFEQLRHANQDYQNKISSVNRDIALRRTELFVQNRQFTLTTCLQSEQLSIQLYNAIQDRALRAAEIEATIAISLFDARVRQLMAQIDLLKTGIMAQLDIVKTELQTYQVDVLAYEALVRAVVSAAQVDIENARMSLQSGFGKLSATVQKAQIAVQTFLGQSQIRESAAEAGARFLGTGLGSALNGINALAVNPQST